MGVKPIRILQVNLNRSQIATETALQSAIELGASIVAIQEPWISKPNHDYSGARSIAHQSFSQILSNQTKLRPRTLIYALKSIKVELAPNSP